MFIRLYLFIPFIFSFLISWSQSPFSYQSLDPVEYFPDTAYLYLFRNEISEVHREGYEVKYALPKEYVKDGSVDYTKYIQRAINEHNYLIFPPFPLLINDIGLSFHSNMKVVFQDGSKILMAPSKKRSYQAFRIWNCSNVSLFYPKIIGDRYMHLGKTGEWGMGIYILNSDNILIYSPKIISCWGDAIYISGTKMPSSNVSIYNAVCDNNRRNAISIISAVDMKMVNILASNTHGTNPMSGIDIEPNKNTNRIDSLFFENIYTINNQKAGFKIQLERLLRSDKARNVNIQIINHYSIGSEFSFYLGPVQKVHGPFSGLPQPINGDIVIKSPVWINYKKKPLLVWKNQTIGPLIKIVSPEISFRNEQSANQSNSLSIEGEEAIEVLKKSNSRAPQIKFLNK